VSSRARRREEGRVSTRLELRRSGIQSLLALATLTFTFAGCRAQGPSGPIHLLQTKTPKGTFAKTALLKCGVQTRPCLIESVRYNLGFPARSLLTFGMGVAYAGDGEMPGWYHLVVRVDGRVVDERKLNPRALRGFRDISLVLPGKGNTLAFELQLTDRDDHPIAKPASLLLGVAEPIVHDLESYGRSKGILLISIDTLRRDHVGAYGYDRPTTPQLDALAREGILCEDAVSTSSWTLPAHLSMLTSLDPGAHGGVDLRHGFNHSVDTLPALLRKGGYATEAVTSHLYVSEAYGVDDGFDHLDFRQDRKATDVADRAMDILDRVGDRPFFLFLHFYDPHWHYDPPEHTLRIFEKSYSGTITGIWQDFKNRNRSTTSAADLAHLLALYDGEIRYTDDEIGRILSHLRERNLERGTLVVVTSDHGEEFLDHGSWEHQKTLYEELIRVPLILRGPGIKPRREKAQASLLDISPTILAWARMSPPTTQRGQSILSPLAVREAYSETDHTVDGTRKASLRAGQGRWKLILSLAKDGESLQQEEWYDLAADPTEKRASYPRSEEAGAIRKGLLSRWRGDRNGSRAPLVCLGPEQRERLQALGYVGAPGGACPPDK